MIMTPITVQLFPSLTCTLMQLHSSGILGLTNYQLTNVKFTVDFYRLTKIIDTLA